MTDKKGYKAIFPRDANCPISAEDVLAFKPRKGLMDIYSINTRQLDRMHKRYGNPLMHHGDCSIFRADLPVCTCGLLHDLIPMDIEAQKTIYSGIEKDWETEAAWKNACHEQYSPEDGSK